MKIAYITSGAAGMYCGSCMHDNTLASALLALGHETLLIPTYTPIRTDEHNVSQKRIFFGGINVYLQQKIALFRKTPWLFDRMLDAPGLLRWVSRFAVSTRAEELGDLAISMLKGEHGNQKKEVDKLVAWLADEVRPQIVNLSNILISGMVPEIKRRLGVPVVATLQGDDVFLESLPATHRAQALALAKEGCRPIDGFIATSGYYADFMADYLALPRERIDVVYPGLNLKGHDGQPAARREPPFHIGYFARIGPEKGFHQIVDAFILLRRLPGAPPAKLLVSGWLGENQRPFFNACKQKLAQADLLDHFEHVECPDHASKIRFLQRLDVLSVPTTYREPKGLYVLEALANGVPVVQPRHGSFPELVAATGGGVLVEPENPADLARGLRELLENPAQREELGRRGREAVHQRFQAERMAEETLTVLRKYAR